MLHIATMAGIRIGSESQLDGAIAPIVCPPYFTPRLLGADGEEVGVLMNEAFLNSAIRAEQFVPMWQIAQQPCLPFV